MQERPKYIAYNSFEIPGRENQASFGFTDQLIINGYLTQCYYFKPLQYKVVRQSCQHLTN